MTISSPLMHRARGVSGIPRLAVILMGYLLVPLLSVAQQGSISGTITDAETGETLIGVNVLVLGTSYGTASDFDGNYRIDGLRSGEYTLKVSYIGYETVLFTGINVRNGANSARDVTLEPASLSLDGEVLVVGERPLLDVEGSASSFAIDQQALEAAPIRNVESAIATQAGIMRDPTGLYIRGGRADETGFVVDGVSAKDPLAGTGFGLDLGSNAFAEIEVTTGGLDASSGDATSGVVSVTTQDGGDQFSGSFSHKRDNFGFNEDATWSNNESIYEWSLGGPIIRQKLRFFVSGQVQLADGFTRLTTNPAYLSSSLVDDQWLPRASNRWNAISKLTWDVAAGMKLQASYQRSITANQNTRMLQVTGNDAVVSPGFQYAFVLQPENANTFAHDNIISYVKWAHVTSDRSFYDVQVSRLFTRLRADANGRDWRPDRVDAVLDPYSIVTYPVRVFVDENGNPYDPNAQFVLPGPGLINNGGIATRWHDHFAEEWTTRITYTRFSEDKNNRLNAGLELKFNDYQWIDVVRPWVGAPIGDDESATATNRLGESSDVWRVKPRRGALFATQQLRYQGLIANVGLRLEYWSPGAYVDALVDNEQAPILDAVRTSYKDDTINLLGLRTKLRLLPRIRVSFPIQENRILFFNYGHSTKLPHPTFVYTGLDPFYQDRSFFADLGNPDLDPEVDVSYEIGLRNQFSSDDVLTLTAFWRDKFDFITVENVLINDATGRQTTRAFRVNGDFARVRGVEASYIKRVGDWFRGNVSAGFSRATGLSSTNNDALADFLARGDIDNTIETALAWDRPFDLKSSVTFTYDRSRPLLGIPGLNRVSLYVSSTFRSGQRYTPVVFRGYQPDPVDPQATPCDQDGDLSDCWRPIYETEQDPALRYSSVGEPWWWFDMSLQRKIRIGQHDLVLTAEVTNLFDQKNSVIINPVTGKAYPDIDPTTADWLALRGNPAYDVATGTRDPRFEDPTTSGSPPFNPARYLPQRHVVVGLSYRF